MNQLWRFGLILVFLVLIATGTYYFFRPLGFRVKIRGTEFQVEVAATNEQKMKGLGYRKSLPDNAGMLFPYDFKEKHTFWMKGMNFPLDFVWIDGTTIVDLHEHVQPAGPPSYNPVQPNVPVDKILELSAGSIAKHGIQIGDTVTFLQR